MKIGFIGLGIMGRPMAKNLLKAGYDLTVFDFNKAAVEDVVACGAHTAENSQEVAKIADVFIRSLCLRRSAAPRGGRDRSRAG